MLAPGGMIERTFVDQTEGKVVTQTTYDNTLVLADNLRAKQAAPDLGQGRYKGNMVHVGRIHMGDIKMLENLGFNMFSPDKDEQRRCFKFIQEHLPGLLRVPGKPFAKQRKKWA